MKCTKCGAQVKGTLYFCPKCGKLVKSGEIKTPGLIEQYEKKMRDILYTADKQFR